jgi:hypothetical protein
MYSMLNAQIIRANQVELAQRNYMAEHSHAIRELRDSSPRRGNQLKRLALAVGSRVKAPASVVSSGAATSAEG